MTRVALKVGVVNNNVTVKTITPQNKISVRTSQNVSNVKALVAGPRGSGVDKNYMQPFTASASITVPHNLGKYPAVTIMDSAGDECEGDIDHLSMNELVVNFSAPFSGIITCN